MNDNATTVLINDTPYTLHKLERHCWQQLAAAPNSKPDQPDGAGFKKFVLATQNLTDEVDARMVVLRQTDEPHRGLWFHTDVRASKVLQLEAYPQAVLLFWDEENQVQLRVRAEAMIHINDQEADEQWKNLWVGSRKMYLSAYKPGTEQPGPYPGFPETLGENLPSEADSEAGRPNFAAVECRVLSLEYLHLSRAGQTRARFVYEPDLAFSWLAP